MTTYTLLPKLTHVGNEITESQKEFVLYKHQPDKTIEFNILKTLNKYIFIEAQFCFEPIPSINDINFIDQYNESIRKVS